MTLMDVLPQVEQLDRDDLVDLQAAIEQLLHARDYFPSAEEAATIDERYREYLADPESSISVDDMMAHLDALIAE